MLRGGWGDAAVCLPTFWDGVRKRLCNLGWLSRSEHNVLPCRSVEKSGRNTQTAGPLPCSRVTARRWPNVCCNYSRDQKRWHRDFESSWNCRWATVSTVTPKEHACMWKPEAASCHLQYNWLYNWRKSLAENSRRRRATGLPHWEDRQKKRHLKATLCPHCDLFLLMN